MLTTSGSASASSGKDSIDDAPNIVFPFIDEFIPKINNWSICDSFCASLKIFKHDEARERSFVLLLRHHYYFTL